MTAVVIGLVFIFLGIVGLTHWSHDFLIVARGFGPFSVFVGGVVSLIAGLASFRPSRADDRSKD